MQHGGVTCVANMIQEAQQLNEYAGETGRVARSRGDETSEAEANAAGCSTPTLQETDHSGKKATQTATDRARKAAISTEGRYKTT